MYNDSACFSRMLMKTSQYCQWFLSYSTVILNETTTLHPLIRNWRKTSFAAIRLMLRLPRLYGKKHLVLCKRLQVKTYQIRWWLWVCQKSKEEVAIHLPSKGKESPSPDSTVSGKDGPRIKIRYMVVDLPKIQTGVQTPNNVVSH